MGAAFTENRVNRAAPTAAKIKAKSRTQVVVLLEAGGVLGAEDLSRLGLVFGRPLGSEGEKINGRVRKKNWDKKTDHAYGHVEFAGVCKLEHGKPSAGRLVDGKTRTESSVDFFRCLRRTDEEGGFRVGEQALESGGDLNARRVRDGDDLDFVLDGEIYGVLSTVDTWSQYLNSKR